MNRWKKPWVLITALVMIVLILVSVNLYIKQVRNSLWEKSVTDILEVSKQGQSKLDESLYRDFESVNNLSRGLQYLTMDQVDEINKRIHILESADNINFYVINLTQSNYLKDGEIKALPQEYQNRLKDVNDTGISNLYYEAETGIKVICLYHPFQFVDGSKGIIIKEIPLSIMVENFTLSFFDNAGFSYITKADGTILIRSSHKNSNRTFQTLSDIIDYEGNRKDLAKQFYDSLQRKESGIAILSNKDEENVFCYLPIENAKDWYLISIVPKSVLDKHANEIIQSSLLLCLIVLSAITLIIYVYLKASQRHHQEIQKMAYYDSLTGLYNFERFKELGNTTLRNVSHYKIAAIYLDIRGFKAINDISGYEAGDKMLKHIASCIKSGLNEKSFAGRVSADNFVVLYLYHDDELVKQMALWMEQIKAKSSLIAGGICIKAGICYYNKKEGIEDINQLMDRARIAHRIAKNAKEDIVFYNEEMRERMIKEAQIEAKMEEALNNEDFVVYLQPQYDVDASKIRGGEALVRWQTKDDVIWYPDMFIPLFERNGFIIKLDVFVFEQICKLLHDRMERQLEVIPISVNVSRVHFFNENFVETFKSIKEQYNIPDGLLILEITESVLAEKLEQMIGVSDSLHKAGFLLAIDDFGSGYSSLNILKELPIDTIKLDREFFAPVQDREKSEIIINNILRMAKELNIHNVAEGVETQDQLNFLKKAGCDLIQGFIFGKAIAIEDFIKLLDKN